MENLKKKILCAVIRDGKVINIFSPLVVKKIAVDLNPDYPEPAPLLAFFFSSDVKLLWEEKLTEEDFEKFPFLKHERFVNERYFLFDRTLKGYYDFFKATGVGAAKAYIYRLREYRQAEKDRLAGKQVYFREFEMKLLEAEKYLFSELEQGKLQRWQLYTVFVIFALFSDYVGDVERLIKIFEQHKDAIIAAADFQ